MSQLLEHWWNWLAAMSCQLVVLVAVVVGLDRLLRGRAWPELRMGLWSLVMVKLVLPPSLTAPWSVASIGPASSAPAGGGTWLPLLFAAWLCGGALLLSVSLLRYRAFDRRLRAGASLATAELTALAARLAARLSLQRVPEILVAPGTSSALVLGFVRLRVVLPPTLAERIGSDRPNSTTCCCTNSRIAGGAIRCRGSCASCCTRRSGSTRSCGGRPHGCSRCANCAATRPS